jgi:trehalose 6-phosphate phosphatase
VSAALPPIARAALLLDLDGTLIDIAPTPDAVRVPPELPNVLVELRDLLGGALAIISGRPVEDVDALLPDVASVVAGEHGAALRPARGATIIRRHLPVPPAAWFAAAEAAVAAHPGALLERKSRGLVLHFRLVPDAGAALRAAVAPLVAADERFELMAASMAWEVRAVGVDKGAAVREVMALEGFAGRVPVFIGDDVTDRDGIAAAKALGGTGVMVGDGFGDARGVRAWLARCAARRALLEQLRA